MQTETKSETYQGWKNYETWNVALYIANEERLYRAACEFVRRDPHHNARYAAFVAYEGLNRRKTADGVAWLGGTLDYPALDEFMAELIS